MIHGKSGMAGARTPRRSFLRRVRDFVKFVAFLPLSVAGATAVDAPTSTDHWNVIGAYNEAYGAYWSGQAEIRRADISAEERERRLRELGPAPDAAPAIEAAMAVMGSNRERLLDAADFLLNRERPSEAQQEWILDAVAAHFGPDWPLVEDYMKSQAEFLEAAGAQERDEALHRRLQQGAEPPTWHAVAAARAIVESNHERALEAAEFLVQQTFAAGRGGAMIVSSWWLRPSKELGEKALAKLIGPDWDVVRDHLADEPLEWVVWHVGSESALVRRWRVTGFPTYVLIGPEGAILSKHPGAFDPEFRAEIEQAVRDAGKSVAET